MKSENPVQKATARVAAASRRRHLGTPVSVPDGVLETARNDLLAAKLERAVEAAINPPKPYEPLRPKDRKRLAAKLRAGL